MVAHGVRTGSECSQDPIKRPGMAQMEGECGRVARENIVRGLPTTLQLRTLALPMQLQLGSMCRLPRVQSWMLRALCHAHYTPSLSSEWLNLTEDGEVSRLCKPLVVELNRTLLAAFQTDIASEGVF